MSMFLMAFLYTFYILKMRIDKFRHRKLKVVIFEDFKFRPGFQSLHYLTKLLLIKVDKIARVHIFVLDYLLLETCFK